MAKTEEELKALSDETFFDNNDWLIDPGMHREFNNQMIETMFELAENSGKPITGWAGRRWKIGDGNPVGEAVGNIELLKQIPELLGLGRYLVSDDRVKRKLDPTDSYRFVGGAEAKLDGSMGQFMWCWNKHYYTWYKVDGYLYETIGMAPYAEWEYYNNIPMPIPAGGKAAHNMCVYNSETKMIESVVSHEPKHRGGIVMTGDMFGLGEMDNYDGTYLSQLCKPACDLTLEQADPMARKRGEGWCVNWYVAQAVTEYLMRIILGTRNSQAEFRVDRDENGLYRGGLGIGYTEMTPETFAAFSFLPAVPLDAGLEVGDGCADVTYHIKGENGEVLQTAHIPVFFGLIHPFGYLVQWVNGQLIKYTGREKATAYVKRSMYAAPNFKNPDGSDYLEAGSIATMQDCGSEGVDFIREIRYDKLSFLPISVGAGATDMTFHCDGYAPMAGGYLNGEPLTEIAARLAGGCAAAVTGEDSSAISGASCSIAIGPAAIGGPFISASLCYFEEDPVMS